VDAGVIHAAGDADNMVSLLDLATGRLLGRRSFDPLPGRVEGFNTDGLQGATWLASATQHVPVVVFPTHFPRGLLEVPVQPTNGPSSVFPVYIEDSTASGVVPGISGLYYLTLRDRGLYGDDFGAVDVAGDTQLGLDGPNDYYVATWDGLVTLPFGDETNHVLSALPGASWVSMGLLPDGRIFGATNQDATGTYRIVAWTEAAAAAGSAPTATYAAKGPIDGAAVIQGALWVFYWDGSAGTDKAVQLDGSLREVVDVALNDYFQQLLTVSPNGRTIVSWESQPFSENTSIVIWSVDPDAGFPRVETIPLSGRVAGAAFDPTGEELHVVMRDPGRILIVN
jgi:hypothetical protein